MRASAETLEKLKRRLKKKPRTGRYLIGAFGKDYGKLLHELADEANVRAGMGRDDDSRFCAVYWIQPKEEKGAWAGMLSQISAEQRITPAGLPPRAPAAPTVAEVEAEVAKITAETCRNGHEMDEANSRIDKHGKAHCRTCSREASRRAYEKKKARERRIR